MDDERTPCASAPADVEDLIDGLLDPAAEIALRDHLASCEACRETLAEEERIRSLLAPPAPAGLADDVMAGVRSTDAERRRGRHLRLVLPLTAAAAAAVLVLSTLGPLSDPPTPPGPPVVQREPQIRFALPDEDPAAARGRDLARRARLFLAAAAHAPAEALAEELRLSGLAGDLAGVDLTGVDEPDRAVVRRLALLGKAWRNGAPIARAEIAMVTEGWR